MIHHIFEQDLKQPEFSGHSWLWTGVLPIGQELRERIDNLLPHEIIGEKSSFQIKNPRLIPFINKIFIHPQLYPLYETERWARIWWDSIQVLKELDEFASDTLERGISIIERSIGYDTMPPFRKLEFLLERIRDWAEKDEIMLPPRRLTSVPRPRRDGRRMA